MEEMVDVLDESGQRTGEVLPKSVVHARELWHTSAHIWIINSKGEILMQYRVADKKILPSCWDTSVAGHVSAGTTPAESGLRELEEEIGLDATLDELKPVGEFMETLPMTTGQQHHEKVHVFTLRRDI